MTDTAAVSRSFRSPGETEENPGTFRVCRRSHCEAMAEWCSAWRMRVAYPTPPRRNNNRHTSLGLRVLWHALAAGGGGAPSHQPPPSPVLRSMLRKSPALPTSILKTEEAHTSETYVKRSISNINNGVAVKATLVGVSTDGAVACVLMVTHYLYTNRLFTIGYLDTGRRAVTKRFYCEIGNSSKAEVEFEFTTGRPCWCRAPIREPRPISFKQLAGLLFCSALSDGRTGL
jgi:hypothetical protein